RTLEDGRADGRAACWLDGERKRVALPHGNEPAHDRSVLRCPLADHGSVLTGAPDPGDDISLAVNLGRAAGMIAPPSRHKLPRPAAGLDHQSLTRLPCRER